MWLFDWLINVDVTGCYKCIPHGGIVNFQICIEGTKSVSRCSSELLKLPLRVIGMSDIEGIKPKLHLLD